MRIFKGLENIHSIIDKHEIEWRIEQGEPAESLPKPFSIEEAARRRLTQSTAEGSGKFSPDRFLGEPKKKNKNNVEVVDVIKQNDSKPHSWLYNEVVKAIHDAVGNSKNTKVVAVFIPVVQNGKEFEDLPVDASVTLPPVNEEDVNVDVADLLEKQPEPEIPVESEETVTEQNEEQNEAGAINEEVILEEAAPEFEEQPETLTEAEEPEQTADFDLIPEAQEHPDAELAEAFSTMEEKLDEALSVSNSIEQEEHTEILEQEETPEKAEEETEFGDFPVITTEENDAPVKLEDVIEEITPEDNSDENENNETENDDAPNEPEELAPLDGLLEDYKIYEEHNTVNSSNELSEDEENSSEENKDNEEEDKIISLE